MTEYTVPKRLNYKLDEADNCLEMHREFHRKIYLIKHIWANLFDISMRGTAIDAMNALIDESRKDYIFTEYLGLVHDTNGECSKEPFIHDNLDKIKLIIDYILGSAPHLEKNISEEILNKAIEHSEKLVKMKVSEMYESE